MRTPDAAANYLASRELVTPRRLDEFFAPKSIAMVGASDNSGWGRFIVTSCQTTGFSGPLMAVHPRAKTAFGLPVVPSLRDLPEPADLAFILAPVQAVESVLTDMGAAGIKNAVVLASGYREVGDDGRTLENAMVSRAIANGITVLGPNCLGFLNAHTRSAPYALTLPPPLIAGPVGVVLQSGALASVVLAFTRAHASLDAIAEAIARLSDTALSLNGTLRALEVNPLWVRGDQVEALDVLIVTETEPSK